MNKKNDIMDKYRRYLNFIMFTLGLTKRTVNNILSSIEIFIDNINKPIYKMNQTDISNFFIEYYGNQGENGFLKAMDHLSTVMPFVEWCTKDKMRKGDWRYEKYVYNGPKLKLPELLTPGEINKILSNFDLSNNIELRNAALICILVDAGISLSECLNLKVKDFEYNKYESVLIIHSRYPDITTIPLANSRYSKLINKIIAKYYSLVVSNKSLDEVLFPIEAEKIIRECAVNSGINKIITSRNLRDFFAVYYCIKGHAPFLEQQMGDIDHEAVKRYYGYAELIKDMFR